MLPQKSRVQKTIVVKEEIKQFDFRLSTGFEAILDEVVEGMMKPMQSIGWCEAFNRKCSSTSCPSYIAREVDSN